MKQLMNGIIVLSCLGMVGCNQLTRLGSQALVFDSDPFADISPQQQTAASTQPPAAAGRVSVGDLSAQPAPPNYAATQNQQFHAQQQQPAAAVPPTAHYAAQPTTQPGYNYPPGYNALGAQPPVEPPVVPGQVAAPPVTNPAYSPNIAPPAATVSNAATRAAEEAAAMIARRGMAPKPAAAPVMPVSQPADVGLASYEADQFEAAPPVNPGYVPMPPEARYSADSGQWELTEADLDLPTAHQQRPTFPGTNIPIPSGRATVPGSMSGEWVPNPPPTSPKPVETQPVFSPPSNSVSSASPAPKPVTPAEPVIQDSTNSGKWRAVRRN